MLIRSRARWLEEGEKPTNYFFNLENRHFVSKRMSTLTNKYNVELNNKKEVEQEIFNFCNTLYTTRSKSLDTS